MKNFWKGNEYLKISLYAILVIIVSILFYRISSNTDNIAPSIASFFAGIIKVISPILYGLLIAYLFNPIMAFFEKYLMKWFKPKSMRQKKAIRSFSIALVYLFIIGTLILVFRFMIPKIFDNIKELATASPNYIHQLETYLDTAESAVDSNLSTFPYQFDTSKIFDILNPEKYFDANFLSDIVSAIMSQAVNITSSLFNWIMGLVIAFYVLAQKENFAYSMKKLTYALFSRSNANRIINLLSEGHEVFIQFFIGKFIDSLIIGIIAFIGLTLMDNPYAILLALIIGVFNMIPYFGPILGAIPAVVITLFTGFTPAVFVGLFIFILQQFDGLVLGPKILGDSIGLSPFWIISGILIGGALWGALGMFFASPIIAVLLANLDRWMDRVLKNKAIDIPPIAIQTADTASTSETPKNKFKFKLASKQKDIEETSSNETTKTK